MAAAAWARGFAPGRASGSSRDRPGRPPSRTAAAVRGPDAARRAAYDLLRAVDERDAYANLVLPGAAARARSRGARRRVRDRARVRHPAPPGTYDAVLEACVDRPLDRVDPPVLDLLRLGTHQLLAHAGARPRGRRVHRRAGARGRGGGPVGSSTRSCAGSRPTTWTAGWRRSPRRTPTDPVGHLAVVHSHPRWVVAGLPDRLRGSRGGDGARCCAADNEPPAGDPGRAARPVHASTSCSRPAAEARSLVPVRRRLAGRRPGRRRRGARRPGRGAGRGQPARRAGARRGAAWTAPTARWLDLCAGSGRQGRPARRRSPPSAARGCSRSSCSRTGPAWSPARRPARRPTWWSPTAGTARWRPARSTASCVDVPCTGLGALRRRPEARWRRQPADVAALAPLQRELLTPRSGGPARRRRRVRDLLPHLAETEAVVGDVLRAPATTVERSTRARCLPGVPDLGEGPDVQLWPHLHGTDAMFLALLRRATGSLSLRRRGHPDLAEHPVRRLRPAGRRGWPRSASADWLHVDVMDNHFVPNLTLGLPVVEALRQGHRAPARLPPDDRRPGPVGARLRRGRRGVGDLPRRGRARAGPAGARAARAGARGRGWRSSRRPPVEPYEDLLPELDMLLLMTVEPGFGGQAFLDVVLPKIRRARALMDQAGGEVWLQVDGGVSAETDRALRGGRRRRPRRRLGGLRRRRPGRGGRGACATAAGRRRRRSCHRAMCRSDPERP